MNEEDELSRLDRFRRRVDIDKVIRAAKPVPLSRVKPERGEIKPLPKVEETRPESLDAPVLSNDELLDAYDEATELEVKKIQYEQAKSGKMPWTYFFGKIMWVLGGLGALGGIAAFIKGC